MERRISIKVPKHQLLEYNLRILSVFFGLTKQQLTVLKVMLEDNSVEPLKGESRKELSLKAGLKNEVVFNNIFKALREKGAIIRKENGDYAYHTLLVDVDKVNVTTFIFEQIDQE